MAQYHANYRLIICIFAFILLASQALVIRGKLLIFQLTHIIFLFYVFNFTFNPFIPLHSSSYFGVFSSKDSYCSCIFNSY